MRRPLLILLDPRAAKEIDEARAWWAANSTNPRKLDDAIATALTYLELLPGMGGPAPKGKGSSPCPSQPTICAGDSATRSIAK